MLSVTVTYGEGGGADVGSETLLGGPRRAELITGRDHPKPRGWVPRHPSMDLVLLILNRVLVLIVHLHHTQPKPY